MLLSLVYHVIVHASFDSHCFNAVQMKETPLSRAAHNGHLRMVKFLVQQGSDVNCMDLVNNFIPKVLNRPVFPCPRCYPGIDFRDVSCIDDAAHDL